MTNTLLPPNATQLERDLEATAADRVESLPIYVRDVWNADACPDPLLPWLAWAFGVERWSATWSSDDRRAAIKSSIPIKQTKGTPYSVRTAIASIFPDATFQEWWQQGPEAVRYTFKLNLDVTDRPLTQRTLQDVLRIVDSTKNLRSHISAIAVSATAKAECFVGAYASVGVELTVYPHEHIVGPLKLNGLWLLDGAQKLDGTLNG